MTASGKPTPDDDIPDWDYPEIADSHKSERTESGMTEIQDARLVARAITRGWIKPGDKRWPTNKTETEIETGISERGGGPTLIEKAMLAVFSGLSGDDRAAAMSARTAVTMEGQNQTDEHKVMPNQHEHSHTLTIDDRRSKLAAIDARLGLGALGSGGVVVNEAESNGKGDNPATGWVGGNGADRSSSHLPDDANGQAG